MTIDVYNYYDGYLSGVYETDAEEKFCFVIQEKTQDAYEVDFPPGRIYDIWKIDAWPTDDEVEAVDGWWQPEGEPTGSITESELLAFNVIPFEKPETED